MPEHKIQPKKAEAVAGLKQRLVANPDLIFSDFRGLTFPQMTDLRAKLAEQAVDYRVVRNAFTRIAMRDAGLPDVAAMLEGPTALAWLGSDPTPAARTLMEFTRSTPLTIKGGVVGGRVFSAKDIEALSRLPGRKELLGQLAGTLQAPLRNLMYVMTGVVTKLVRTLAAVAEKKPEA
jgi:large subunit ribosomal protein L10